MSDAKDQRFLPSSRIEKQKDVLREERMSQTEHKEKRQSRSLRVKRTLILLDWWSGLGITCWGS